MSSCRANNDTVVVALVTLVHLVRFGFLAPRVPTKENL
jgi:hypothetical protein